MNTSQHTALIPLLLMAPVSIGCAFETSDNEFPYSDPAPDGSAAAPICDGQKLPDHRYAIDDVTPIGFSGEEAILGYDGLTSALTWSDNQTTDLELRLTHDVLTYDGDCFYIVPFDAQHPDCFEYLEVPVLATLTTADGRMDVELGLSLQAGDGILEAHTDYYAVNHIGDLDFSTLIDGWDEENSRVFVALTGDADELHGSLTVITHQEEADPAQTLVEIATW